MHCLNQSISVDQSSKYSGRVLSLIGITLLIHTLLALALSTRVANAAPAQAQNRVDVSASYTFISVGDWQMISGSYTRSIDRWVSGLGAQVLRREFSDQTLFDFSLSLPAYWSTDRFGIEVLGTWSPTAYFSPSYSIQLSPSIRFWDMASHLTYRFAEYPIAYAHVLTPGFSWSPKTLPIVIGVFVYLSVPEFGANLITPQLRFEYKINYFWSGELWTTYGYETLNDRFVDPTRQAPQLGLYFQGKHLFNDWSGLVLGLSWTQFFADERIAQERFNQDRFEISLRSFIRF